MRHFLLNLLCAIGIAATCTAQTQSDALQMKNISDTFLLPTRKLEIPGAFDGLAALKKLFPGKYYDLSHDQYKDQLINWECKTCKTAQYIDSNEGEPYNFPFAAGVATRLINVMSYKDSAGAQYKMVAFNHSEFDPDGAQTSRFTGGTIGFAKFALKGDLWTLTFFQPAIGAYGAFSNCPAPVPVLIGHDQYAFMIKYFNGGAGGPFYGSLYLLAGANGAYREIFAFPGAAKTAAPESEELASWECTYEAPESDKRFFRDIIVTIKGIYTGNDKEDLPEEVRPYVKAKKGKFTLVKRYVYKGSKGYQQQGAGQVTVN